MNKFKVTTRIVSATLLLLIAVGSSQGMNFTPNYLAREIMTETGTIEVNYVDEIGNLIQEPAFVTGNIGEEYNIEPVTEFVHDGSKYTLTDFNVDKTGVFTEEDQIVSFVYKLNEGILSSDSSKGLGIVEIDYVDTDGNIFPHADYETGTVGEQYTIQEIVASVVNGNVYRLVERQGDLTGTWKDQKQIVTFIYELDESLDSDDEIGAVEVTYTDEEKNNFFNHVDYLSGKIGSSYSASEEHFDGYILDKVIGDTVGTFKSGIQRLNFIYGEPSGVVNVSYLDENGEKVSDSNKYEGIVGQEYFIEIKDIPGYKFDKVENNLSNKMSDVSRVFSAEDEEYIVRYVSEDIDENDEDTDGNGEDTDENAVDEIIEGNDNDTNEESTDSENTELKDDSNEEGFDDVDSDSKDKSSDKTLPKTGEQKFILTQLIGMMIVLGIVFRIRKRLQV